MGQGLVLVSVSLTSLVSVAIADGAIDWEAVEVGPANEELACKVGEVVVGIPLQSNLEDPGWVSLSGH